MNARSARTWIFASVSLLLSAACSGGGGAGDEAAAAPDTTAGATPVRAAAIAREDVNVVVTAGPPCVPAR